MTSARTPLVVCRAIVTALLATSVPLLASEPGGATPQEVYDRYISAQRTGDLHEIVACLTPVALADQNISLLQGVQSVFAMAAYRPNKTESDEALLADWKREFDQLLEAHNFEGIEAAFMKAQQLSSDPALFQEVFGSPRLFADLTRFGEETWPDEELTAKKEEHLAPLPLEDLVVDGERATGAVPWVIPPPGGPKPRLHRQIDFLRIGGRWYVHGNKLVPVNP